MLTYNASEIRRSEVILPVLSSEKPNKYVLFDVL